MGRLVESSCYHVCPRMVPCHMLLATFTATPVQLEGTLGAVSLRYPLFAFSPARCQVWPMVHLVIESPFLLLAESDMVSRRPQPILFAVCT